MNARLAGKVVLITGAANGIGASIAELFASHDATVVVTDVDDDNGRKVLDGIESAGLRGSYFHLDVRDPEQWERAIEAAESQFGPIDVLVSNAFVFTHPAVADLTVAEWNESLAVNLTGPLHGIQAVLQRMRKRRSGNIVVISATNGNETALPGQAAYQAAKSALSSLTRHVALTYGHEGIRANSVHPGGIETAMLADQGMLQLARQLSATFPIARLGRTLEVASAALFLASDESSYVTGAALVVDGGASIGMAPPSPQQP